MGQAELAIELLTTDSEDRAAELAAFLDELNQNRDSIKRSIYLAADKQLKERFDTRDPALVLADRGWHAGVIGIVAGRLAEKYSRPVVMIALDELGRAMGQGSARFGAGAQSARDTDQLCERSGLVRWSRRRRGVADRSGPCRPFPRAFL